MEAAKNLLSKTFNNSRSSYVDQDDNTAQIRPKVSLEQRIHPNPDAEVQRLGVLDKGAESDGKSEGKSSQIHAEQMEKLGLNSALWWNVNPSGSASRPNISDWTLSLGLGTSPTAGPSKPMASSAKTSVTDRFGADYEQLADMALRRNQTQAKGKKPAPIQTSSSSDRVFRTAESSVGHTTSESSNGRKRKMVPWSIGSKRQKLPDTQAVPHERDLSEFGVRSPTSPRSYPDSSELNHNYPHGTESGSSYYAATAPSSRSRSQATPSTASAFAAGGFGRRSVPAHSTGDLRSEGRNVNALPRSKSTGQVFDPSTWEYQVVENLLNTKSSSPSAPSVPSAHASHHTSSGRPSTTTHSNSNPASPTSPRYSRPSQQSNGDPYGPHSIDVGLSAVTERTSSGARELRSLPEDDELSDSDDSFVSAQSDGDDLKKDEKLKEPTPMRMKHSTEAAIVWAMGTGVTNKRSSLRFSTLSTNPRLSLGKTVTFAMPPSDSEENSLPPAQLRKKPDIDLTFEMPPKRVRTRSKIDYSSDPNFLALSPHDLRKKYRMEKRQRKLEERRQRLRSPAHSRGESLATGRDSRHPNPSRPTSQHWSDMDLARTPTPSNEMETFIRDIRDQPLRRPSPRWKSVWSTTSEGETESTMSGSVNVPTSFKPFFLIPPNAYLFVGGFLLFPLWIWGSFYPVTSPDGTKERWGGFFRSRILQRRSQEQERDLEKGTPLTENRRRSDGPIYGWPADARRQPQFGANGDEIPGSKRLSAFLRESQRDDIEDEESLNYWAFQRAIYTWRLRCRVMLILSWCIIVPFIVVGVLASR